MKIEPRLFQLVVEQTRDYAMFLLDPNGRIATWNQGARRIKGYEAHEIIGRHFSVFYPKEAVDSGWPEHEIKVATAEGRFEDEGWRIRKDGSRFWADVIITALRDEDGSLLGFSKITRDLTDRKLHEEALRQSEERFRLLVEGVSDYAIFMLDPEGLISSWNLGAERIKGYTREEILGKHFSRFYEPEAIEQGKPREQLAKARAQGRVEDEGWRLRKDGSRFWARVVVTALHDQAGRLRGFAKITQDLTERRHLEDLQRAAKNLSEFIATLAHELRNPLAPIRTAVQVMGHVAPGDPQHDAMRQTIDRQSAHLARIVDDMLDIARITRGTLDIQRHPVTLGEVVQQAVEMIRPEIAAGDQRLELDLATAPLVVNGDLHRLIQLLGNLLSNATRYTPKGGRIAVSTRAEGNWAVLRVRDSGRGIEPDMLESIFGMFVQGRPAMKSVGGGLGIGLALARRIAEMHGGTLAASSEGLDQGSEFTLRLPLQNRTPASPEGAKAVVDRLSSAQPPVARRVLIVDDNVDAAITLEMLLRSLGHETRVAHGGMDALELAVQFQPEVVLLDIGMPGISGYEVARRLRTIERDRPLCIVAVTGWGQDADRQRSREAGFDLHLVKPVDLSELARVLEERNSQALH
jgi:PAS domain S-box-containing protein